MDVKGGVDQAQRFPDVGLMENRLREGGAKTFVECVQHFFRQGGGLEKMARRFGCHKLELHGLAPQTEGNRE